MRGKLGILLGVLVFVTGTVGWSAPAMGDSVTNLGSFSDPRTAMKQRPGHTITRIRYGQSSTANFVLQPGNAVYNALRFNIPAPCTNCYITDMVPNLVYNGDANHADGTTANLDTDAMLHHFVMINPGRADPVCPGGLEGQLGERFFAAGNERSQMHLPDPFGYLNNNSQWRLISHVINKSATAAKSLQIEVVYQWRTATGGAESKPLWLDIDGCGDSEYTTPVGYFDATTDWVSTVNGRMIGIGGHLHDVDITNASPCTNHCPEKGHGIAVSTEIVGGNSNDYYGPVPPNNPPPASLTGATMCRSEGLYGTAWAGNRYRGHLDTMTGCLVPGGLAPTYQQEAWPATGAYPSTGYPFSAGQTLRVHSEYQNDNPEPQTDVMGIMMAWYVPTSPGYIRAKNASPTKVSLVPAFNACTSPNRVHGPPDFPGNGSNPDGSCNPPVQSSSQLTIGGPENGLGLNGQGSVKALAISGNTATQADEADARFIVSMTDVRRRTTGFPDYTGQLQLETSIRVTDKNNGPSEVATMQDTPFKVTVPCSTTADTGVGSTCSVNTTADAVIGAGTVQEGKRTIWALGQVRLNDGGADGVASTTPNSPFMVQGVMVP